VLADSGEPLPGARVRLLRHGVNLRTASADANGGYLLDGIPEGRYTLQAMNPGYVALEYGQRKSTEPGRTLHVRHAQMLRGIEFVLPRGNVVTGNVIDEHGQPVEGAVVRALQLRFVSDRMMTRAVPGVRERRTDDRGYYRLFGLLPGEYFVTASIDAAVSGRRGASHGYAPSYYPGTANIGEAWRVPVDLERDTYGAHVVLAPSPAVRVSGTVHDSQGRAFHGLMLLTTSRWSRAVATEPRTVPVNGTFIFNNVPPGDYVVQATAPSDAAVRSEFVTDYVRVSDGDVSLSLVTSPGARISGRVFVDGTIAPGQHTYSIVPVPADLDRAPIAGQGVLRTTEPDGRFAMSGVHGPFRLALSGGPPEWYVKRVTINGMDVTDAPYEFHARSPWAASASVLISANGGTIRGRVIDDRSAPVSEYTVIVFANDPAKRFAHSRYTKFARPSQDDSFELTGLPPGDFRVAAVASLDTAADAGAWQDPAMLGRLSPSAERVTVSEGSLLDLTLRRIAPSSTRR
jgi:hypothetical protein